MTTTGDETAGGKSAPGASVDPSQDATRTSVDSVRRLAPEARLAGRYRIQELVGVGGMGMVYRAHDEQLDLPVAIKVLRPEMARERRFLDRFRKELVLARQVTHRNAVRIHDIGQDEGLLFLTMDYVPGDSLREVLEREGPLGVERSVGIAHQLAAALEAAHQEGVVHRDLKPANVLIDESGRAYITDFGVARSLNAPGMTRPGAIVGTLDYLSPEQARGEEVDARSDLYTLGILLFEMLSGQLPFAGSCDTEVLAQRLAGRPRDLRHTGVEIPAWLRKVVCRLLERDPRRRYQSARELMEDLDRRQEGSQPWRAVLPWAAAGLVLALTALLVWGVWGLATRRPAGGTLPAVTSGETSNAPRHSVVVLPLADDTGRPDLAWASSGIAEMLADALAESPDLRVVESLRVFRTLEDLKLLRGSLGPAELRRLADLLDADRIVSGRLRASGDRVRVDLDLVSADLPDLPARPLHAEVAGAPQVFGLVEDLGTALRERLQVASSEPAPRPTSASPVALAAYSEGLEQLLRGNDVAAAPALERAVAADPGFSAAWLRLARARHQLGHHEKAVEAARRAVEILGESTTRLAYEAKALAALLEGKPERAQTLWAQLVERYPNDVEAKVELAEAYGEQGSPNRALPPLKEAIRLDANHPRACFLLGKYSIHVGDARRAVDDYLVHALVIQKQLGNLQGQADVYNAMGVAYQQLGEFGRAEENYGQAAEIRLRIGDERGYATSVRNLAQLKLVRREYDEAEAQFERALEILERIGDSAGAANVYNDYGALAEERGDYRKALEQYRRALRLRRDLGDELDLAQSLNNVGYCYYLLGQYDDAMVYWRQGLDLYLKGSDQAGVISATQSIGQLQLAQGNWDAAVKSLLEALGASREVGMKDATAVSQGGLGRVAQAQGRFSAAEASYSDALSVLRELDDPRGLAEYTLAQADLDLEVGLYPRAAEHLAAAERLLAQGGNHEQRAELLRLRGEWHLRQGKAESAAKVLAEAVKEAEASHSVVALLSTRLSAARAALFVGADDATLDRLRSLHEEAEALGNALLALRADEVMASAALARGDIQIAERLVRAALGEAKKRGAYAGTFRLHLSLAKILEARGQTAGAAAERESAATELERLRRELTPEQRRGFDAIPEVQSLTTANIAARG